MTIHEELLRDSVIARVSTATVYERRLDGLVWLNAGCDYPRSRRNEFPPCGPANRVNGRTMRTGYELGLSGVESSFMVPELTTDIGAAFKLLDIWFPHRRIDLRTECGPSGGRHRSILTMASNETFVGTSPLGAAAAVCVSLLKAIPYADTDPPGYSVETDPDW